MIPTSQPSADPYLSDEAAEAIRATAQHGQLLALLTASQLSSSGVQVLDGVHIVDSAAHGCDRIEALRDEAVHYMADGGQPVLGILHCSSDGSMGFSPADIARLGQALPDFRFLLVAQSVPDAHASVQVFTIHEGGVWSPSAHFDIAPDIAAEAEAVKVAGKRGFVRRGPKVLIAGIAAAVLLTAAFYLYRAEWGRSHRNTGYVAAQHPTQPNAQVKPEPPLVPQIPKVPGLEAETMMVTPAEQAVTNYVPPQPVTEVFPDPKLFAASLPKIPVEVMLEIHVEASGTVSHVHLIRAVPPAQKRFAEESIRAAENWIFKPARASNTPVECNHIIIFRYSGNKSRKKGRAARATRPAKQLLLKKRQLDRHHLRRLTA